MKKKLSEKSISEIQNWKGFKHFDGTNIEYNSQNSEIFSDCEVSVLMQAIAEENLTIIRELCDLGANVNRIAKGYEESPLLYFEKESNKILEITKILVSYGADINYFKTYDELFDEGRHFTNPLSNACEFGNYELVKYLLENGAKINFSIRKGGPTPICSLEPESKDYLKLLNLLIEKGADVNSDKGVSLILAVDAGHLKGINVLLKAGAEPNLSSKTKIGNGKTAIMSLMSGNCENLSGELEEKLFENLVDHSKNINETDTIGQSLLFYCVDAYSCGNQGFDLRSFSYLIDKSDCNVNILDNEGNNILIKYLLKIEDWETSDETYFDDDDQYRISKLLKKGVNTEQVNNEGRSAQSIAEKIGNKNLLHILKNGANEVFLKNYKLDNIIDQKIPDVAKQDKNDLNLKGDISRVVKLIRLIGNENKRVPKTINELPELVSFGDFSQILSKRNKEQLKFSIPNLKLFGIHDFVVSNKEQNKSSILVMLPYLIAISISIYGITTGNYWLILTILIVVLSSLFSTLLNGVVINLIVFGICAYSFYEDNLTIGLISLIIIISTTCTRLLKIRRRKVLFDLAESNEEIFTFLFHNRTLSIIDIENDKVLYSKE